MNPDRTIGEFDLIRWFRERTPTSGSIVLGIGDDAAVLRLGEGADLVVTTDMLMDGRHFVLKEAGPRAVGYKAMAVNISDLAAMAARPRAAVVAVALPKGSAVETARGLHGGLSEAAARFGVALIGGDTNAWDGPLVVTVTALGETTGRGPVRRSGAKPGDVVFVTGPLGGSLLGRHLRPTPRVDEALALNAAVPVHALIDVSDGLASDLGHILEESGGLGALIDAAAVPVHEDAVSMAARDGRSPLEHALHDGEDFELCVVVGPEDARRLESSPVPGVSLFRVATIEAAPGLRIIDGAGVVRAVGRHGFDHLRA